MSLTAHKLTCLGPHGFYKLAYTSRLPRRSGGPPVVCVHGLTRTGRDFDVLGERLGRQRQVVAPDMPGRGQSDFLPVKSDYGYPLYLSAVAALIGTLDAPEIDYVGTSMGGIIGMMLASQPNSPVRRLVLNDVGPLIPKAALAHIATYVGQGEEFDDLAAVEAYYRRIAAPYGALTDGQWRRMAEHGHRRLGSGKLALNYDPDIALPFRGELADVDLWPVYDLIRCPTLVIRGGESGLLLAQTAQEMARRGPKATLFAVLGAGHAPALMAEDQLEAIEHFLAEGAVP